MLDLFNKKLIRTLKDTINDLETEHLAVLRDLKEANLDKAILENQVDELRHNNLILLENAEELRKKIRGLEFLLESTVSKDEEKPAKKERKPRTPKTKKETISKTRKSTKK